MIEVGIQILTSDLEPLLQDIYNIFQIVENHISNISTKKSKIM